MTQINSNIWNAMLDAEYNVKVIDRLGKKYYKYDMYSKILLVIMTLSSFLILVIWGYYPVFLESLIALSTIIAIVIPIINLPKSMQILIERANKWGGLSFKYNRLWENRYNEDEDDLQVKYDQIKNEEYIEKEEVVFHLSLSMKEKEECQNEVLKSRELEG